MAYKSFQDLWKEMKEKNTNPFGMTLEADESEDDLSNGRGYRTQSAQPKSASQKAMLNGEDEYNPKIMVEKPGESIHSEKWDDCIRDVQSKGEKVNAFAVCTAQLGQESFKSQYQHLAYTKSLVKKARTETQKMGIGFAGPVPTSLLADQDLEPIADDSEEYLANGEGCEYVL
jgi:hypothetical protein